MPVSSIKITSDSCLRDLSEWAKNYKNSWQQSYTVQYILTCYRDV